MVRPAYVALAISSAAPCPTRAQSLNSIIPIVGRIEDARNREPISGVRVRSADSASIAITDSLGNFALILTDPAPRVVYASRLGYRTERFELQEERRALRYVLLLEPVPIEIEGLTVEVEAALQRVFRSLERRRKAYPFPMRVLDPASIQRWGRGGGSVLALILREGSFFECRGDASQLCVPSRYVGFLNPYGEDEIMVCVDGRRSPASTDELRSLPPTTISLVEIYGRRQVRVYTANYLVAQAKRGWVAIVPAHLDISNCA